MRPIADVVFVKSSHDAVAIVGDEAIEPFLRRSEPVGAFPEGIFVSEGYRKQGFAAELLSECEKWAKEKGCTEFAGNCELGNVNSVKFHMSLGFEEANRITCFRKDL